MKRKNEAESTADFHSASQHCCAVLAEEHQEYAQHLKEKMHTLRRGSKLWWKINLELVHKNVKTSSIPPLRNCNRWVTDSKEKADLLAETLASKSKLPDESGDCPFFGCATDNE